MAFFEYTVRIEADTLEEANNTIHAAADATIGYFSIAYEGQIWEPDG